MSTGKDNLVTEKVKSPAGVEFGDLFRDLGWKPFMVAKRLHVSPAALSMLLNGKRSPSRQTLEGLRELVARQRQAKLRGEEIEDRFNEADRLEGKLNYLRQHSPEDYVAVKTIIETVHRKTVSSGLTSEEEELSAGVEDLESNEAAQPLLKPQAVGPAAGKSSPSSTSSAASKAPHHGSQGKARRRRGGAH